MTRRRPLGRNKYEWKDNIKMRFNEVGHAKWIKLKWFQLQTLVNTAMKLRGT